MPRSCTDADPVFFVVTMPYFFAANSAERRRRGRAIRTTRVYRVSNASIREHTRSRKQAAGVDRPRLQELTYWLQLSACLWPWRSRWVRPWCRRRPRRNSRRRSSRRRGCCCCSRRGCRTRWRCRCSSCCSRCSSSSRRRRCRTPTARGYVVHAQAWCQDGFIARERREHSQIFLDAADCRQAIVAGHPVDHRQCIRAFGQ